MLLDDFYACILESKGYGADSLTASGKLACSQQTVWSHKVTSVSLDICLFALARSQLLQPFAHGNS